jgi:hypothetical protein
MTAGFTAEAIADSIVHLGSDSTDEFCRPPWSVQAAAFAGDASVAYGQAKSDLRLCAKEGKEDV